MTRHALAVRLSPAASRAVGALDRPALDGVRWTLPVQWMVKVRPLGHVAPAVTTRLVDVLGAELDGAPAVVCTAGPATARPGGQWLYVPVTGLEELGAVVFEVTAPIVPVTHPQPFHAEVVLATGRIPRELGGVPLRTRWTARQLVLVADRSSPRGPRFEDVATFPLGT